MLVASCGGCHGADGGMAGLDLTSFAGALAGGSSGPAIVPGDPDASSLVLRQQAGATPVNSRPRSSPDHRLIEAAPPSRAMVVAGRWPPGPGPTDHGHC
jgi:hypothetical protein